MLTPAMLRWTLLSLGCSAIVLLGASPTDRSPPHGLPAESPPKAGLPLADAAPEKSPRSDVRHSVVKLSEAEVVEALKIMKQLDDNPLAGTLMDQPLAARSTVTPPA